MGWNGFILVFRAEMIPFSVWLERDDMAHFLFGFEISKVGSTI